MMTVYIVQVLILEVCMTSHVGTSDRMPCATLGLGLICLGFFTGAAFFDPLLDKYAAATVGFIMLIAAQARFCPVHSVVFIKTSGR